MARMSMKPADMMEGMKEAGRGKKAKGKKKKPFVPFGKKKKY